jgi:hypothetical protein
MRFAEHILLAFLGLQSDLHWKAMSVDREFATVFGQHAA